MDKSEHPAFPDMAQGIDIFTGEIITVREDKLSVQLAPQRIEVYFVHSVGKR